MADPVQPLDYQTPQPRRRVAIEDVVIGAAYVMGAAFCLSLLIRIGGSWMDGGRLIVPHAIVFVAALVLGTAATRLAWVRLNRRRPER